MGFHQHFELERPLNCKFNLIAEYCAKEFSSTGVSYATHGMVCLFDSHGGLNFCDVICARRYVQKRL